MIRVPLMLVVLLAAGCEGGDPNDNAAPATNRVEAAPSTPVAAPKPSPVPAAECPPPAALALSDAFVEPGKLFAPDSNPFRQTKAAFEAAYDKACASGILGKAPLVPPGMARRGILLLNNPEANNASIYRDGDRSMLLVYPFVTGDGATHVPTEEELGEAIYCFVHGASDKEQEESGRCLPD